MNIQFLKECDEEYYNTGNVLVSDIEYDNLKDQLKSEFPNDPYFQTVGSTPQGSVIPLPYTLGSLNKTKPNGTFLKWCKEQNISQFVVSDKLDGVSIFAEYFDGKLVRAMTRGDGYKGRDITEKVRVKYGYCKLLGKAEFRGEAVMTDDDCTILGYSLPRSAVAGIFNSDDEESFQNMVVVDIVWYNVMGEELPTYSEHFSIIDEAGFRYPAFTIWDVTDNAEEELSEYLKERKEDSVYGIDGLVVSIQNDPAVGEDYYPDNMVAFKVNAEAVRTPVTDVKWEVKRSGKIQPVVHFEPIMIDGTKVTKATGFNAKFIKDNHITPHAEIGIVKSGDIIPYITECYTGFDGAIAFIPSKCPSCGRGVVLTESKVDIICINIDCPDQMIYRIEHFLLAHEVEEITATTLRKLGITSIEGLYDLSEFDIAILDGMGIKRGEMIVKQLQKTLNTTQEKMLKSFGITGIGNTASNLLINTFGTIEKMFDINMEDIMKLDGFGEKTARRLIMGLVRNMKLYTFLKERGLKFEEKASTDLQGKIFTLTGKSDISRNDLLQMIGSHGGMVKGISKKVDYLVTNDPNSTSGKMKKAIQYGITIISYEDLLNIIS